jgi:predicted anti-sigma-YlaC factor YlaD
MKWSAYLRLAFGSLALALSPLSGCSVENYATGKLADALSQTGSTYATDDDPELVREAVPFGLKLVESVLEKEPRHAGLLLAASSGFTQYAFAFVEEDADEVEGQSVARAAEGRLRAKKLYLRARGYALRGLELDHPGLTQRLRDDRDRAERSRALADLRKTDVPFLYWSAASWAGAIHLAKDDPETVADLPIVESLMDRALELDESFGDGAIHALLLSYESSRPGGAAGAEERARSHFRRAVELSDGKLAGPMVALAEAVAAPRQDRKEYEELLHRALAIDVDAKPEWRLQNLVLQRRARWLLDHAEERFVE